MGSAFTRVRPSRPLFPGISLNEHNRCVANFGARPFAFPPPGLQALQPPPAPQDVFACEWLLSVLARSAALLRPPPPPQQQNQPAPAHGQKAEETQQGPAPGLSEADAFAVARAVGDRLAPLLEDPCAPTAAALSLAA